MKVMDSSQRIMYFSGFLLVAVLMIAPMFRSMHGTEIHSTTCNIIFRYGISGAKYQNQLDTFRGLFKKDMVNQPPAITRLDFTQEEMDKIYEMMEKIDFFSYPSHYEPIIKGDIIGMMDPSSTYYLEFHGESNRQVVRWSNKYHSTGDPKYQSLNQLARFIIFMIESKPEYQRLPEPTAGYV